MILRVRYPQAALDVRCLLVERKNRISVVIGNARQPTPNAICLASAASMTNSLDTLPQFTNRDGGQIERGVVATGVMKECLNPGIGVVILALLADDVRINQKHAQRRRSDCRRTKS